MILQSHHYVDARDHVRPLAREHMYVRLASYPGSNYARGGKDSLVPTVS